MKKKHLILLPFAAMALGFVVMDGDSLSAVRAKMTSLAGDADKIISGAADGLTAEQLTQVQNIHGTIDGLRQTEKVLEKQKGFIDHLESVPPEERRRVALDFGGLTEKEAKAVNKFSFRNFITGQLPGAKIEGFEKEMLEEGQKDANVVNGASRFHVPRMVLNVMQANRFTNDITVGGSGTGAEVVSREPLRGIIDPFYEAMAVRQLGAQYLSGLVGDIPFPKMGRDSTKPAFKTEVAAAQEITATTAVVTMSPKRLPAFLEVSEKFLRQTDPSVETWLRNNLLLEIGVVWEKAILHGGGAPAFTGIAGWSGIGSVAGGTDGLAPTYSNLVDLETALANANAAAGNLAYLTNSKVRGKLKKTALVASTDSEFVWDRKTPEAPLNGYRTAISNCVSSALTKGSSSGVCSAIFFANWSDLVIGQWGGLDILVNPYSRDTEGIIRINAAAFGDSAVLRAESFAAMLDALTA